MIVVRNVFQLKFGKAREAVAVMKEGLAIHKRLEAEGAFDFSPMSQAGTTRWFWK
jgi:hypothetical protein